jgi:hypothetical protein
MSKSRSLVTVAFLVGSGAAFAAALQVEAGPAWALADNGADDGAGGVASEEARDPTATPAIATATGTTAATPPTSASPSALSSPSAPSFDLPDFKGKRLSVAQREARALGLAILARNDVGGRVPPEQAPFFRVRRQLTPAGASVQAGATVELRVREAATPSGY